MIRYRTAEGSKDSIARWAVVWLRDRGFRRFAAGRRIAILWWRRGLPTDYCPEALRVRRSDLPVVRKTTCCVRMGLAEANLRGCFSVITRPGSWLPEDSRSMPRPDSSVVERGPEKAGVGGSIPSLATTF